MSSHPRRRGGWRGGRGGGFKKGNPEFQRHSKRPQDGEAEVDESSPIIKAFRGYQVEMDAKNDRHERIMKLNRDITIDSKRLVFLLQRVSGSGDKESLLMEAEEKMKELHSTKFLALARELSGQDIYQFLKAFTGGLQEYIEAVTFYYYLTSQELVAMERIQSQLIFSDKDSQENQNKPQPSSNQNAQSTVVEQMTELATSDSQSIPQKPAEELDRMKPSSEVKTDILESETAKSSDDPSTETTDLNAEAGGQTQELRVPVPPSEYMLGVADFTGELMRMAINSVGAGDLDTPRVIADMMKVLHNAFSTFSNTSREFRRKTTVLRQSLNKVERACYTLKVRGSEIPKHMLTDVFTSGHSDSFMTEDVDSGYD